MCDIVKLPEVPKVQGTAGGVKTALQQVVERPLDGKNPRNLRVFDACGEHG